MDRFFVQKQNINLETNTCIIEGEDVKHISKVLRCKIGEELEICDNDNNEYICEITDIDKSFVSLNILEKVDIKRESDLKYLGSHRDSGDRPGWSVEGSPSAPALVPAEWG